MPAFSAPTLANPFCRAIRRPPTWVSRSPASSVAATPAPGGGANRRQAARATRIRSIPCVRSRPALLTPATPMTVPPNHSADPRSCTACATTWLSVLPMLLPRSPIGGRPPPPPRAPPPPPPPPAPPPPRRRARGEGGRPPARRLPGGNRPRPGGGVGSEWMALVGLQPAPPRAGGELDPLALVEAAVTTVVGDRGEVHEHVLPAVVGLDEPEPLLRVEPLHGIGRAPRRGRGKVGAAGVPSEEPPVGPAAGPAAPPP